MTKTVSRSVLLPHRIFGNIYVRELGRAYAERGVTVLFGPENLYESNHRPDWLHLHWPEDQYRGYGHGSLNARRHAFIERLDALLAAGTRLIWTVHNITPHEHTDSEPDRAVYQAVIDRAELIFHHCETSVKELAAAYKVPADTPIAIAPHGNYNAYPDETDRATARSELGIDPDAIVYLLFGSLRGYKGVDLVLNAFRNTRVKNKFLLVAGKYSGLTGLRGRIGNLRMLRLQRSARNARLDLEMVEHADVQRYLRAADAMVLGHRRGLNSGVGVLGVTFGKLVIGPELGCLTGVLRSGPNIVYPPGDCAALTRAMEAAATLDLVDIERRNRALAAEWTWTRMADAILNGMADASSKRQAPETNSA